MDRRVIVGGLDEERAYLDNNWGPIWTAAVRRAQDERDTQKQALEAMSVKAKDMNAQRPSPLKEIRQVVITGVACLERYAVKEFAESTNDTPNRGPE